jgi:hypothetical protein
MIARRLQALVQRLRSGPMARTGAVLSRPGARRRMGTVLLAVVLLCSAPAVVGALPVSAPERSVPQLLEAARSSASVAYTGYAESRGTLNLPDVSSITGPVLNLLSARSRLRVWNAGANRFRVDRLTLGAENDAYVSGPISVTWDSDNRRISREVAPSQTPMPTAPDVLPPSLGRRLLELLPADGAGVLKAGDQRVAGRATTELRWRPNDPRSLIGDVRLWIDPTNGVPMRVELRPVDSDVIAFETAFVDFSLTPPTAEDLTFDVGGTPRADVSDAVPPSDVDLVPPYRLPPSIGGLPQRSGAAPFIATYGEGAALVAVTALDSATADSVRQQIDPSGRPGLQASFGEGSLIQAPMLRALVFSSADRGYILAGTVTLEVLERMAQQLVDDPPERTFS